MGKLAVAWDPLGLSFHFRSKLCELDATNITTQNSFHFILSMGYGAGVENIIPPLSLT